MSNQFITNKEQILSEVINKMLPQCNNAYFLVGYFYFSGFIELCEKLKDIHLKVLVGLDVERSIINGIKEVDNFSTRNQTRAQVREDYYNSLVDIFNNTDFFDDKKQEVAFELMLLKIKDGSLEIRKTEEPNHSKLYLFQNDENHNEGGTYPGKLITGSSNLSVAGLRNRMELNAILRDKNDYMEGQAIFDELWADSVPVVDLVHLNEFQTKVVKKIWYEKLCLPYLMYLRVLSEYFSSPTNENILTPYDITDGSFVNLKYQTDAVQMALKTINIHSGVIIADVVGLGKSIIASTVARNLRLKTIVICPPHLKNQWEEYKDQFGFTASIFSSGLLESALNYYREISKSGEKFLIIVDEAHKYKNEGTLDYSMLHDLCTNNKVMLLTATPFNNAPSDIYSMLKLFQIPSKSTLKTVNNLGASFSELIKQYEDLRDKQRNESIDKDNITIAANSIAKKIRSIITPLVIRRSRLDLEEIPEYREDLKLQHIVPIIPEDPISLNYDLAEVKNLYLNTLNLISPSDEEKEKRKNDPTFVYFKAARYKPSSYFKTDKGIKEQLVKELEEKTGVKFNLLIGRQANLSSFMRRMLVGRFESSVAAFGKSLSYMIDSSENILKWIDKRHKVPVYKKGALPDVDDFYSITNDDQWEELSDSFDKYQERGFFEIDVKYISNLFVDDIKADIKLLKDIRKNWFSEPTHFNGDYKIKFDYKLDAFKQLIRKQRIDDPQRKIVVFTEYADTANYLGESLKDQGLGVFKYTAKDASLSNKDRIRANFDAGLKPELQKNDYQILIATDAISEGYNLHRAGTVFNYDIPYNPTRVIQRIGRINRINKKMFDKLYIYNYFPTDIGEKETRTKEISTLKMAMIHAIMGEDTKALTNEEELNAFFKERYQKELDKSEERSWDNPYRIILNQMKGSDILKRALDIPHRVKIGRKVEKTMKGVILFGKKGSDFVFKFATSSAGTTISLTAEEAISLFEAKENEVPFAISESFNGTYQKVKKLLFKGDTQEIKEKNLLEAKGKISKWIKTKSLSEDYLNDLLIILKNNCLTIEEIRFINKLATKNIYKLPQKITQDYINRIVNKMNSVEDGNETLILAEELQ